MTPSTPQRPAGGTPASQEAPSPVEQPRQTLCAGPVNEESICPSCGATMRLWANYFRCRTCGYKESCCF